MKAPEERSAAVTGVASTVAALAVLVLGAHAAPAQSVQGTLVSETDGSPVSGAYVVLTAEGGDAPVDETLTGDDGTFRLDASSAGRYRLRAERIGFRTWTSASFRLDAGETRSSTFRVGVEPVSLEDVTVDAERTCDLGRPGARAAGRVLEEARKALRVLEWARAETRFAFDTREFSRLVEREGGVVRESRTNRRSGVTGRPYVSLSPDTLREAGFVASGPDSVRYYGPDVNVLRSRQFVETHCFRVRRGSGASGEVERIGVAFEPAPGRDEPDIEGTLWLDAATAKLQELEFTYVNLPADVPSGVAGGNVTFRELPTGDWIVDRWRIEVPQMQRQRIVSPELGIDRTELSLFGMREAGGRVTDVRMRDSGAGGESLDAGEGATVTGFVYDSLRGGWLSGARVYVPGGPSARTGARGDFSLSGVPPERIEVRFDSPRMRALGVTPEHETLIARPGRSYTVQLATPGPEAVRRRVCGADSAAVLAGRVELGSSASDESPNAAGTEVRVWQPGPDAASGSRLRTWSTTADSAGAFRLCGVPRSAGGVVARFTAGGRHLRTVRLPVGESIVQWQTVVLEPGENE